MNAIETIKTAMVPEWDFDDLVVIPKINDCMNAANESGQSVTIADIKKYLMKKGIAVDRKRVFKTISDNDALRVKYYQMWNPAVL